MDVPSSLTGLGGRAHPAKLFVHPVAVSPFDWKGANRNIVYSGEKRMRKFNVAVVGAGAVGHEMLRVLRQRSFPVAELRVLARREREELVDGVTYKIEPTTPEAFDGIDFALFAGTEGEKGASQQFGWLAVEKGAIVIDNGDDYRMDPRVPLVIPEINADHLARHQGFISNPNCSTIIMLMAVAPLHKVARAKRLVISTYQAVSGTGKGAIEELRKQVSAIEAGQEPPREVYPHRIAFNVMPQVGSFKGDMPGYNTEEVKMLRETRKILADDRIRVTATCVRVPVYNGHSEAINAEFEKKLSAEEAREILRRSPGVQVVDDPAASLYPTPLQASGKDDCLVGRIREDQSQENTLDLWVSGDNIRKGAALNAVQIAEKMIEMGLVK